jgi:hypothetical protein
MSSRTSPRRDFAAYPMDFEKENRANHSARATKKDGKTWFVS